jgi:hypothetical protein
MKVIRLLADGLKNKEIAEKIGTTEHVVKNYLRVIYDKLGLWNRVEVALWYVHNHEDHAPLAGADPEPETRAFAMGVGGFPGRHTSSPVGVKESSGKSRSHYKLPDAFSGS